MECPAGCPDIIYNIMMSCWNWEPNARPSFWEIHGTLVSLLQPPQYFEEEELIDTPIVSSFSQNEVSSLTGLFSLIIVIIIRKNVSC